MTDADMNASGLTITTTIREMGAGDLKYWRAIMVYVDPDTGKATTFDSTCEREYSEVVGWAVWTTADLLGGWRPDV